MILIRERYPIVQKCWQFPGRNPIPPAFGHPMWRRSASKKNRLPPPASLLESAPSGLHKLLLCAVHGQLLPSQEMPCPSDILAANERPPTANRSSKSNSNPNPGRGPSQPSSGPDGPEDGGSGGGGTNALQLRYWIFVLTQYGGIYGTSAVLIAGLTQLDAFGGLHWDAADVALGLSFMAPVLVFDALVGLPDWSTRPEDAPALVRLFMNPDLLGPISSSTSNGSSSSASGSSLQTMSYQNDAGESDKSSEGGQPRADDTMASADDRLSESEVWAEEAFKTQVVVGGDETASEATATSTSAREEDHASLPAHLPLNTRSSDDGGNDSSVGTGGQGVSLFGGQPPDSSNGNVSASRSAVRQDGLESTAAAVSFVPAATVKADPEDAGSTASNSSGDSGGSDGVGRTGGRWWAARQRLRMALELMQESSIRNNIGAGLTPLQEAVVILVATTADDMLYRAVLLTLFGHWLRDRAYEAGAEEVLILPGDLQLDTAAAASWVALGGGLALGLAVFALKAWQEAKLTAPMAASRAAKMEAEAVKEMRKQRLMGEHISEEQMQQQVEKQSRIQAAQLQLAASVGTQAALVWLLEGGRDLVQFAASGSSFLLTANLAAPLAGNLLAQVLVSLYQRLGLRRAIQRRLTAQSD